MTAIVLDDELKALLRWIARCGGRSVKFYVCDTVPMGYEELTELGFFKRHRASIGELSEHLSYVLTLSGRAVLEKLDERKVGA